jgi:hypothetical protein
MQYALGVLAIVGFVVAGHHEQNYIKEVQAHEILEQYGTRLQHCLNQYELETVSASRTLNDHQKNFIYEEDMRTCEAVENNSSIITL